MKLLIASSYYAMNEALIEQLSDIVEQRHDMVFVSTVDEILKELVTDAYDFIITEYAVDGMDIWQLAKLINSKQLSVHALPVVLLKETCQSYIPLILAKEHRFSVVSLDELADTLKTTYARIQQSNPDRSISTLDKPTLIIIEDDPDAAYSATCALKGAFDIDTASDGLAGLELWLSKRHDLVLLDYMLPMLTGDKVLEKMMAVDKNQPVIIITAFGQAHIHQNFILNGASEFLSKPFSIQDLRELCQTVLTRSKLIYQAHYEDTRVHTLRNLFWVLEHSLAHHDIEKAQRIVRAIKAILPSNPSEDEQLNLIDAEF
ncbi:MAG: response regulator [Methylicorpusculum sp.]|uniref:response regulator n=1 Tax=Methylicorpusculum sp. TaxID=2713644 RepID=UPI00272815E3|nr:response regulator [Methylicorpusculum sp.]MDO8941074.1 response regulator [Methylicorpusculum sp.]MDP2202327.1 response regulator [Methylicorpusculum sp.]